MKNKLFNIVGNIWNGLYYKTKSKNFYPLSCLSFDEIEFGDAVTFKRTSVNLCQGIGVLLFAIILVGMALGLVSALFSQVWFWILLALIAGLYYFRPNFDDDCQADSEDDE